MAFSSGIGKPIRAKLKLWDRDPTWGPLPGPYRDTPGQDPPEETLVGLYLGGNMGGTPSSRAPLGRRR